MSFKLYEEDARKLYKTLFEEENILLKENYIIELIKKYDLKQRLLLRICYNKLFPFKHEIIRAIFQFSRKSVHDSN